MRENIRSVVEKNFKKVNYNEKVLFYQAMFDAQVESGMSDVDAYEYVESEITRLFVRRNYLISSIFFPILSVLFILLNMQFSTTYTWVIFPIGLNVYLYLINVNVKYLLIADGVAFLLFLYFYLWVFLFGIDKLLYAFVLLYIVFLSIMLIINQFKFVYVAWPTAIIFYFIISYITQLWSISWIIFPLMSAYEFYRRGSY